MAVAPGPVTVFVSYSHEDQSFKDELIQHLSMLSREGKIAAWDDRLITPGAELRPEIDRHLDSADIILLLVSPSFLASDYCYDIEMGRTPGASGSEGCDRHSYHPSASRLVRRTVQRIVALPTDAKPVTEWRIRDEAFRDIVDGIRKAIDKLGSRGVSIPETFGWLRSRLAEDGAVSSIVELLDAKCRLPPDFFAVPQDFRERVHRPLKLADEAFEAAPVNSPQVRWAWLGD